MKPAFDKKSGKGTLTAANSTPLTDGASSVLLASEDWAKARGLPVLAYLTLGQVAANDFAGGDGLLMAPTIAVSDMLRRANLSFADIDLFEIHEAFAAQVLCTLKAWDDPDYNRKVLGRETPLGADRSRQDQPQGLEPRLRPSVRRDRRAHPRPHRQAAEHRGQEAAR